MAINPTLASVQIICDFLQNLYDEGLKYSTICGYVSAISVGHSKYCKGSFGQVTEISQFLKGIFRLRPPIKHLVPSWDLTIVLKALCESPYEPAELASLQAWTWKCVFLVAVTSASRVSELQALDSRQDLTRISENRIVFRANPAFTPKVPRIEYINREIELVAFKPSGDVPQKYALLCPVRAIKIYLQKTRELRKDFNLFLSYDHNHLGCKVSSQTISRWIKEVICHSYRKAGIQIPRSSVKAHSTRAWAASLADLSGVSPKELCAAALWSSSNVFVPLCFRFLLPQLSEFL